jgi:hypothetical protein
VDASPPRTGGGPAAGGARTGRHRRAGFSRVARKLSDAHTAIAVAPAATGEPSCGGPLGQAYTGELLMVQTATCYREVGRPQEAVALYRDNLPKAAFVPRDRAYFAAQLTRALAAAGDIDDAAETALATLPTAVATDSRRTIADLRRTVAVLERHAQRAGVRELREALAALSQPRARP